MPELNEISTRLDSVFSTELIAAIVSAPLPPLGLGQIHPPLQRLLVGGIGDHLSSVSASKQMELLSGLWLVAGDCHESHTISQDLASREGSFLHGIMHRREADFGNAKYWFARVGEHPIIEQIDQQTNGHYGDAIRFVDTCQAAATGNRKPNQSDDRDAQQAMASQWIEWQVLMAWIAAV